jgi:hypothetical protein
MKKGEKKEALNPNIPLTKNDFIKSFPWKIFKIMAEFIEGFELISELDKRSATFFRSYSIVGK